MEAYLGAIISALLIKTAYEILRDTISKLLGSRPSLKLTNEIYDVVRGFEGVIGAYDLMFHDYGPDKMVGSIHIEVAESTTAAQIDALTRRIQNAVFAKFNIILDTVGIYAFNKNDPRAALNGMLGEAPDAANISSRWHYRTSSFRRYTDFISTRKSARLASMLSSISQRPTWRRRFARFVSRYAPRIRTTRSSSLAIATTAAKI